MKKLNGNSKILGILVAALALIFAIPADTFAQYYGQGGMGGMGMGGYGMGGMGGMGMGGGGAGQPGQVTVKYGEKVYDAVFGDLIDYKVYYIPMTVDQIGVNYFDDGERGGDEVAYDGLASNITINTNTYLGPFSIKYKKMLQNALKNIDKMGALSFYNLNVATEMEDSQVSQLSDWKQQLADVKDSIRARLAQFEGFDDETYVKSIDPSMFESLEGFGGGPNIGPGGILPDMPPPPGMPRPNVRGNMMDEEMGVEGGGVTPQEGGQVQESGRFNPIGRAQSAVNAAEAMNQLP